MFRKWQSVLIILTSLIMTACATKLPTTTPTNSPQPSVPPATLSPDQPIGFITPTDKSNLSLTPDSKGTSEVEVQVQINVPGVTFVSLDANGQDTLTADNPSGASSFVAHFSWQPLHGDGSYLLSTTAFGSQKDVLGTATIRVNVSGTVAAASTPTIEVGPSASVLTQIQSIFQQQFSLDLPYPAVAKKFRQGVSTDPWVSTAWLGNSLYQVYLYPDGHSDAYANPISSDQVSFSSSGEKVLPVCKPVGTYNMLVIFIDYGNLGVTTDEVKADLQQATKDVNAAYSVFGSILSIQTTGVVIPIPSNLPGGGILTKDLVESLTGLNPSEFGWVTQVDLDANSTTRLKGGSMEQTSFGYATGVCSPSSKAMDIWVGVDNKNELTGPDNRLLATLLSHEVFHLFGYPASHFWACTDGKAIDPSDMCDYRNIPSLLLGWIDTDGDGVAEILDKSTPYGQK